MLAMVFVGFGRAQFSGTIETWLDNNYRIVMENQDHERKVFGFMLSRSRALFFASSAIAFLTGAIIATFTSREFVFQLQGLALFFLIGVTLLVVKNVDRSNFSKTFEDSKLVKNDNYFLIMLKGLYFVVTDRKVFFFILGRTMLFSSFQVFLLLLYYPILFGYSGSDSVAGLVQSLSYITLIFSGFIVAFLTKKANTNKLPVYSLTYVGIYFSALIVLILFIPISDTFNVIAVLVLLFLMISVDGITGELAVNLLQRVSIDLVPSNIRNSVYSLSPSLVAILGLMLLPIIGGVVDIYGIIYAITILELVGIIGSLAFLFVFEYRKKNNVDQILE
jgi:hypothetical protein